MDAGSSEGSTCSILPGIGVGFKSTGLPLDPTQLTATLVLAPTGVHLATEFWTTQTNLSYGQAAPYAAAMIVLQGSRSTLLTGMVATARKARGR